jgi:hypothetical protein
VVVGAALSADVEAPTERVYSAPVTRRGQSSVCWSCRASGAKMNRSERVFSPSALPVYAVARKPLGPRKPVRRITCQNTVTAEVWLLGLDSHMIAVRASAPRLDLETARGDKDPSVSEGIWLLGLDSNLATLRSIDSDLPSPLRG